MLQPLKKSVTTSDAADSDGDGELSLEELKALTVAELRSVAGDAGYEITKTKKSDIIDEILTAQEIDITEDLTAEQLALFTVEKILEIAEAREYTITETEKADIITEFLTAQEG